MYATIMSTWVLPMEAAFSIREMLLEGVGFLRELFAEGGQDEKSSGIDAARVTMKKLEDLAHEVHRKCGEMEGGLHQLPRLHRDRERLGTLHSCDGCVPSALRSCIGS